MASQKLALFFLLFLISWASTTLSQGDLMKPCIIKLMPCVDFLHSDKRPSSACCMALKDELENDVECLCELFNDDKALKAFNITKSEVIQFPKRCGLQSADVNKCKKSGDVPMPPVAPSAPSTPPKSPTKGSPWSVTGTKKMKMKLPIGT
uniref:Non-specific lipid transfer protein GPI-anchored 1 n=1 Tax=Elaeis guineensis var. tenera TaxID=51953 RepID=A0A6I9QEL8_ELAGV|nr:non-specific lipid transfer protein GPI-anchored 1 [Elaeis guineensis]